MVFFKKFSKNIFFTSLLINFFIFFCVFTYPIKAATLLSDTFTGTTINTSSNWDITDPSGTNITQNGVLTVNGSYSGSAWGATSAITKQTFSRTDLVISAKMSGSTAQLLAYGDYNFQTPGKSAYIIDIVGSTTGSTVFALSWVNGSMPDSNMNCGTHTAGATYTMKLITTGFEVYKNTGSGDQLLCSLSTDTSITNKPVFFESETSSTFDDLLITDSNEIIAKPSAVSDLSASSGNQQVTLSWTPPATNGALITDYAIDFRVSTESNWTPFVHSASTDTTATITGLTNLTLYQFRVRAINSVGTAQDSNIPSATPSPPTAPGVPTSVTALAGNQQATISFTAPANNGSPITSYTVTSSLGGNTQVGSNSPIVVTGLTNGVEYNFTVTATNSIGTGSSSVPSNSITPNSAVPINISNLVLWLDASDTDTVINNSGIITQINDKSDNANNFTASGNLSPTLVSNVQNGKSVMRFNGNNHLSISSALTYKTIFVVAKFSAALFNSYNGIIGDITATSPNNGHILNGIDGTTNLASATNNFTKAYRNGYEIAGSTGHDFSPINEYWIGSFELSSALTNTTSVIGEKSWPVEPAIS